MKPYPLPVQEGQGGIIGSDFVIAGGFTINYESVTAKVYAIDLYDPDAEWRRMDDLPRPEGITHGAFVILGSKMYMCGG